MKLSELLELSEPGVEFTCWDTVIDSEFYFYSKEIGEALLGKDEDDLIVDACMEKFAQMLDVVKIHNGGVEVNLYELLEHPQIVRYAKENFYVPGQYEDDEDIVMLLFDDNVSNFSNGFYEFSRMMLECLEQSFVLEQNGKTAQMDAVIADAAGRASAPSYDGSKENILE